MKEALCQMALELSLGISPVLEAFEQDHLVQHPLLKKDTLRSKKRKKGSRQVTHELVAEKRPPHRVVVRIK